MNITITCKGGRSAGARKLVAFGVALIQAMVFSIILCPVAALYGFGLYLTTAIALWPLIEHDYGTSGGERANMIPALVVLYSYLLAVLLGVVFCYRGLLRFAGKKIVKQVAKEYKFEQGVDLPVWGYLKETRIGCETNPSFARGRNLITYAVGLMELESPDDLLLGTRILDTLITYDESPQSPENLPSTSVTIRTEHVSIPSTSSVNTPTASNVNIPSTGSVNTPTASSINIPSTGRVNTPTATSSSVNIPTATASSVNIPTTRQEEQKGSRMAMVKERLIGSSSSGKIFQKLLKELDSRSPCDAEMRKRTARIVCALAGDIRLKQFPGGIGCISSLLDASLHQDVNEYKELVLQGLGIIKKLATDEENCRVMSDTDDLVSMIMKPLSCDVLHQHRFTNLHRCE
ncbi:hypothetical protein ACQJBY_072570 [Aegilops geniculata]